MNAEARRKAILQKLAAASEPVSASTLAGQLGVTRQIVVGDVALLRAGGTGIDATPRGYRLAETERGYAGLVACCHNSAEEMRRELYAVADQGCVVVDVLVENALYGEIRASLNVASRYDADTFLRQAEASPASLLSRMTGGVHLHTIRCPDEAAFHCVEEALRAAGVLYEK